MKRFKHYVNWYKSQSIVYKILLLTRVGTTLILFAMSASIAAIFFPAFWLTWTMQISTIAGVACLLWVSQIVAPSKAVWIAAWLSTQIVELFFNQTWLEILSWAFLIAALIADGNPPKKPPRKRRSPRLKLKFQST